MILVQICSPFYKQLVAARYSGKLKGRPEGPGQEAGHIHRSVSRRFPQPIPRQPDATRDRALPACPLEGATGDWWLRRNSAEHNVRHVTTDAWWKIPLKTSDQSATPDWHIHIRGCTAHQQTNEKTAREARSRYWSNWCELLYNSVTGKQHTDSYRSGRQP